MLNIINLTDRFSKFKVDPLYIMTKKEIEKKSEKEEKDYVKSTNEGRLYIDTIDLFEQEKVQEIIEAFLNSGIIKEIKKNQKNNPKVA